MVTVKLTPALATPPAAVTTTLPVVAPVGTTAVTLVLLHGPIVVAAMPLKVTVPFPWLAPKFVPVITTEVPTGPDVGARLMMLGAGTTVNPTPALATPPDEVTTTFPLVAPVGTTAVTPVLLHPLTDVAAMPLNFTVPDVVPKLDPAMTIDDPMAALLGVRPLIAGVLPVTIKSVSLNTSVGGDPISSPIDPVVAPAGTTTVKLVSLHDTTLVTAALLKKMMLPPCAVPKLAPVTVTEVPTGPVAGENPKIVGAKSTCPKALPGINIPANATDKPRTTKIALRKFSPQVSSYL